jgi:hypothetical protein
MILENGSCSIGVGGPGHVVIEADMAEIKNDTLILRKSAGTRENSLVVVIRDSSPIAYAKSASIRFLKEPTDMVELTVHQADVGITVDNMTFKINLHWSLRKWSDYLRGKIMSLFV